MDGEMCRSTDHRLHGGCGQSPSRFAEQRCAGKGFEKREWEA